MRRRIFRRRKNESGYTLTELMLIMGIMNMLISIILPEIRNMVAEAELDKAEQELMTIKTAVTSYWRNNNFTYPDDIHASLINTSPQILLAVPPDPFFTDSVNNTYGYLTGDDFAFGPYFAIYTQGPKGDTIVPVWDSGNQRITFSGGGRVVSNAPVLKTP